MNHIIIKHLEEGYVRLIPEQGYILKNTQTQTTHSEAVVKLDEIKNWTAVEL